MQLILASQSEGRKKLLSLLKIPFKTLPSTLDEEKIIGKTPLETIQLRAKLKGEEITYSVIRDQLSEISKKKLSTDNRQFNTFLIISADSGAILDNRLIGKPKDYQDAVRILKTLSGKTHEFVTAVCTIRISKIKNQRSKLKIKNQKEDTLILNAGDAWEGLPTRAAARQSEGEHEMGGPKRQDPQIKIKTWQTFDRSFVTFRKLTDGDIKLYLALSDYTKYAGGYTVSATPQSFITKIEGSISNVIGLPLEKVIPKLKLLLS